MKAVCPICEKAFELAKVVFEEGSGVIEGKGENDFFLVPEHEPTLGKAFTEVVSEATGEVIKRICYGSFCTQRISAH